MMRYRILLFSLAVAWSVSVASAAAPGVSTLLPGSQNAPRQAAPGVCRLAVIGAPDLVDVADLLQAELGGAGVEMVERTELDRILAEHALNRTSAATVERASQVGGLLGADAMLLLRKGQVGPAQILEWRLVRVSPGIVLESTMVPWPVKDQARWSTETAAHIRQRLGQATAEKAIAISPAHFQPVNSRAADVALAQQAALLVEHGLTRQPGLIVLERAAVQDLARERTLLGEREYWSGRYLLDGSVETSVSGEGPVTLTLRLQPAGGGAAKSFRAQGPHEEMAKLVAALLDEMSHALALAPLAAEASPEAEAQRYADAAKGLGLAGLYFPAYRAAEMAALLGLRGKEFDRLRIETLIGVLAWQGVLLSGPNGDAVQEAGWDEAWIAKQLGGEEWLRPPEWLPAASLAIDLWRDALLAAVETGDRKEASDMLQLQQTLVPAVFATSMLLSTAPGADTTGSERMGLRLGLQEVFDQALASVTKKNLPMVEASIARMYADLAPAFTKDAPRLGALMEKLLHYPYSPEAAPTGRAVIAAAMLNQPTTLHLQVAQVQSWTGRSGQLLVDVPHVREAWLRYPALLAAGTTPELQFASLISSFSRAQTAAERIDLSNRAFALLAEHRDYLLAHPGVVGLLGVADLFFFLRRDDAPKFISASKPLGPSMHSEEMLAFRRGLFLAIAQGKKDPLMAMMIYDREYRPEEGGPLMQQLQARAQRIALGLPDAPTAAVAAATAAARAAIPRDLRPVADYRAFPPLRVARSWALPAASMMRPESFRCYMPGLGGEGNHLWIYGDQESRRGPPGSFLFEISVPSMELFRWPLPEEVNAGLAPGQHTGVSIQADADHVYLIRSRQYFAIGDRRTRKWELHREVSPSSPFAVVGDDLYFLTEVEKNHGLMRYSRDTGKLTLVASNRRVPAATPLDDPTAEPTGLFAESDTQLRVLYARKELFQGREERMGKGARYTPAQEKWEDATPYDDRETGNAPFRPITSSGLASAARAPRDEQWQLQLSRRDTPRALLPFEFVRPESAEPAKNAAPGASGPSSAGLWYRLPGGYVVANGFAPQLWFITDQELNEYLDAHVPKKIAADEAKVTGSAWQFQ